MNVDLGVGRPRRVIEKEHLETYKNAGRKNLLFKSFRSRLVWILKWTIGAFVSI